MAFLVVCPGCLRRLQLPGIDPVRLARAGAELCSCERCGAKLLRNEDGMVVTSDRRSKLYAIPTTASRAIVRRERRGRISVRARGWLAWLFTKRVIVTDHAVEVRYWLRRIRHAVPVAEVSGALVIQHVMLNPPDAMWAVYLVFGKSWIPLAGHDTLERAIEHASAINIPLVERRPPRDPYRGLLQTTAEDV